MTNNKSPVWHPFAQHGITPDFAAIERAEGAYLYTTGGERIIDAISSWWVITHGHCHPRIQTAIKRQADKLDQVIFANYTHEPAETLARALVDMTPDGLDYVFYSDSGSTAVEVALKMALGYWRHSGSPRHRLLVLEHGYHGDTVGSMSVGARGVFNADYEPLLFDVGTIPFPSAGAEQVSLDALEWACKRTGGDKPAAFIAEPLVLGAGGMAMYGPETLAEMARICQAHDVLFIADEVMTGWGRTGTLFACEQAGVVPDIVCMAKGLTGGALPLAVTMCAAKIFDAHYSPDRAKMFFHSSSFTANPITCAAAVENIAIWNDEPVKERINAVCSMQATRLDGLRGLPGLENIRRTGTITAVDVRVEKAGYLSDLGPKMQRYFAERALLIRPLGNTVYLMPPYCITGVDMDDLYAAIAECVVELAA